MTEYRLEKKLRSLLDKDATSTFDSVEIDLKDPKIATVIAWLLPGAGHFYQGRHGKAILFMTCILGLFIFGMTSGGGKVVYASLNTEGRKIAMICQAGVGAPVFPAWLQMFRMEIFHKKEPILQGFMAPPGAQILPGDSTTSWLRGTTISILDLKSAPCSP